MRYNYGPAELYEEAIRNGEARMTDKGALVAITGQHTGRSAQDKFVVRDSETDGQIWWDNNKPMNVSLEAFDRLYADFKAHAADKDALCPRLGRAPMLPMLCQPYCDRICLAFSLYS